MEKFKKYFTYIVILILLIVIAYLRGCGPSNPEETIDINGTSYIVIKREVDTVYQEVKQVEYREGKTIYKEVPIYVNVPADIDTAAVLNEYYSVNVYKDTLQLDSNLGYITITDTIIKNAISGRIWNSNVKYKTIHETIFVTETPKNQYFLGVGGGVMQPNAVFLGPNLVMKTKKDHLYSLNAGVSSNLGVFVQASANWKIQIKLPLWLKKP